MGQKREQLIASRRRGRPWVGVLVTAMTAALLAVPGAGVAMAAQPALTGDVGPWALSSGVNRTFALPIDPASEPVLVEVIQAPGHGAASVSGASVSYESVPGYTGPDALSLRISNADGFVDRPVSILVTPLDGSVFVVNDHGGAPDRDRGRRLPRQRCRTARGSDLHDARRDPRGERGAERQ